MLKKTVCRRCGEMIQVTREFYGGKLRTFRFNMDGSPHRCQIKISVEKHFEWAKFDIDDLERCGVSWRLEGYRRELHRLRHGYKTAQSILKELRERLDWHRWKLKLIEKLLKIQWDKLWSVPTHNYYYKAVDNFFKWYKDYYETVYLQTNMAVQALNRVLDWFYDYNKRFERTRTTEPLALFNNQLDEILHVIRLVQEVAVSEATKAEKEYWLRQITQATEWQKHIWIGYGKQLTWWDETETIRTLLLDYEKAIIETKKRFQEAYQDRLATLTGKPHHGYYIDGTFDYRIQEGIQNTFRIEATASKNRETHLNRELDHGIREEKASSRLRAVSQTS